MYNWRNFKGNPCDIRTFLNDPSSNKKYRDFLLTKLIRCVWKPSVFFKKKLSLIQFQRLNILPFIWISIWSEFRDFPILMLSYATKRTRNTIKKTVHSFVYSFISFGEFRKSWRARREFLLLSSADGGGTQLLSLLHGSFLILCYYSLLIFCYLLKRKNQRRHSCIPLS